MRLLNVFIIYLCYLSIMHDTPVFCKSLREPLVCVCVHVAITTICGIHHYTFK